MVAASGRTKPETGRGIRRSLSAASIMLGRAAIDVVAENPMNMDGYAARKNRSGERRAMSPPLGRYTTAMNTSTPMTTAAMNQSIARTTSQPYCAAVGATSAKMPIGAMTSTQWTIRMSASVAASAMLMSGVRRSSGSVAVAIAKIVTNTITGSRLPSAAALNGFAGTNWTMNWRPVGIVAVALLNAAGSTPPACRVGCFSAGTQTSGGTILPVRDTTRMGP